MKSRFRGTYLLLACLVCIPGVLRAQSNAPTLVPIQGQLNDDAGNPIDGEHTLRFELYNGPDPESDTLIYEETHAGVNIDRGFFTAFLGRGEEAGNTFALSLFREHKDLYLGIAVDDDELGTPLLEIGTSGYAAFAQYCATAATVQGMSGAELQPRVTGSCENGAISQIGENGQVDCQPIHKDTRASAGDGLQEGTGDDPLEMSIDPAYTQRRVTGTCTGNQFIQEVDQQGGVSCGSPPAQPSLDCVTVTEEFDVAGGNFGSRTAECTRPDDMVVGGGIEFVSGPGDVASQHFRESYPEGDKGWRCSFNNAGAPETVTRLICHARCCRMQ